MAPLIEQLWASLPIEYQLPQDIRTHFKDGKLYIPRNRDFIDGWSTQSQPGLEARM